MRKIIICVLIVALSISTAFFGMSCKDEQPAEEVTEEVAEEITEEETVEEVEETMEGIPVPENEVTLDYWFQDWSGGVKWQTDFIKVFEEKYPTIKINLIPIAYEELNSKMIPSIAQGNEGDILFCYTSWFIDVDISKLFLSLSPAIYTKEEFEDKIFKIALDLCTGNDGEIYGIPLLSGGNALGINIHKDLADDAGIDLADINSWQDLKDAAEKLTVYNDDGTINRSGITFNYHETAQAYLDMILMQGAKDKLFNPETGEWDFNIPESINAMEFIMSFIDEKIFDPESGDSMTAYPNKIAAMMLAGPWALGAFTTDYPELDLNYIVIPVFQDGERAHVQTHWGSYMLSKGLEGDKKNAGLLFIKEVLDNPDFINIPYDNKYWVGLTSSKAYVDYIESIPENERTEEMKISSKLASATLPAISPIETIIPLTTITRNIIYPEIQKVFLGQESIVDMMSYLTGYVTLQEQEAMK